LSISAAIFSRGLQLSKGVSNVPMDSVTSDETDSVGILSCSKALICSKFEIMGCSLKINSNTLTFTQTNPIIV
jgi:hypothetical protein